MLVIIKPNSYDFLMRIDYESLIVIPILTQCIMKYVAPNTFVDINIIRRTYAWLITILV